MAYAMRTTRQLALHALSALPNRLQTPSMKRKRLRLLGNCLEEEPSRFARIRAGVALCYAAADERTQDEAVSILRQIARTGNIYARSEAIRALNQYSDLRACDDRVQAFAKEQYPKKGSISRWAASLLTAAANAAKSFHPKIIYTTVREHIGRYRETRALSDGELITNSAAIASRVKVRFAAAIAVSELVGTYATAPILGSLFQYASGNAYQGILGTVLGDYIGAFLAFDVAWLGLNTSYYKKNGNTFWSRATSFAKDVLPIHAVAVLAAIPAYVIGSLGSAITIAAINWFSGGLAHKLPVFAISEYFNIGVAEITYLAALSSLSVDPLAKIISRYTNYIQKLPHKQ